MTLRSGDPEDWISLAVEAPAAAADLISAGARALRAIYPEETLIDLDGRELHAPNVSCLVARRGGRPVGCAALVDELSYGVVRRLFVAPEARGLGLGAGLMLEAEQLAADLGLRTLRVETGSGLPEAVRLYRRLGYRPCPPFGPYPDAPGTLFMEKRLI